MESISVVTPTLIRTADQLSTTFKCLRLAREKTKLPFKQIIVETETNYLEEWADKYIHIPNKTVSTKDLNVGFKEADGKYVVLLTNDVYVEDGWLECLLDCFKKKDCGISTLGSTQFDDKKQVGRIEFGIWCSVFMTKKEYFEKFGYFDDQSFPNVFDDTDFIMRLALAGLSPYKNWGSIAHHKIGMTHYKDPRHEEQYNENRQRFNDKYKGCGHPLFDFLK